MPTKEVPEGSVIISPQDVYTEVRVLTDQVRQLVAKDQNDPLPGRFEAHERDSKDTHDKLTERIRALELKVAKWSAGGGLIGGVVAAAITQIAPYIGN